jgi:predicted permease
MTTFVRDLRYAARMLARAPGFAAAAVITLALGIGANAAIFALVNRVLLTLLPVRNPRELVLLRSEGPIQGHGWSDSDIATSFTYPMYRDLAARSDVFAGLMAEFPFDASVSARGATERAAGELVSGNAFDVLGVVPAVGRVLTQSDDRAPGAHSVAILSHGYWTRRFGADSSVLNKTIVVNGQPLTVVGVARDGFSGIQPGRPADVFVPMMEKAQMTPFRNGLDDPKDYWVQIVGRLKPGLSRGEAQTRLAPLYRSLLTELAPGLQGWDDKTRQQFVEKKLELLPGGTGRSVLRDGVGKPLVSLMGMVALVLLIACSNLAGLLAARGVARQREYGIRLAIGAGRGQLLRQSIVECLVFCAAGGALGLLVAQWTLAGLLSAFPPDFDLRQLAVQIDGRVVLATTILSLVAALFFGLAPTLRAIRLDPASTLRGSERGGSPGREALRFRRWLVTSQIALTLVLLVAAGLFVRTLQNLGRVELGLKPDGLLGFTIAPELNGYAAERTSAMGRALIESLSALPGVRSATAAELPTLANETRGSNVRVEGLDADADTTHVQVNEVAPDYFATMGIPLVVGRELAWKDDANAPKVAVINETMAKKFFPHRSPLGGRFGFTHGGSAVTDIEIVGVVRDSKSDTVDKQTGPFAYLPWQQNPQLGQLTFYLRSSEAPKSLAPAIRAAVARIDAQLPVFDLKTLRTQISESLLARRVVTLLSAAFGVLAALLSALGIYGVLAFAVAQRRREIGVRIALGATPSDVRRLVLVEVAFFLAVGSLVGLPAAWALGHAVRTILFGVPPADVSIFAGGVALLALVALSAAYPPARRAARTNAIDALRSE